VTESGTGQYFIYNGYSEVAGTGTPYFNFSGAGGAVGVNNRGWLGGFYFIGDSNTTVSHEVLAGGGTTIEANSGAAEIRGTCRSLTIRVTDAETVQFVGVTGPITLNDDGATTATVNLYGISTSLTDNTTSATVGDSTVSNTSINAQADTAISDAFTFTGTEVDANIAQIDGNAQAATNLKQSSLCIAVGTVVDDAANTSQTFEVDTTLGAKAADYFGNSTSGGMVLAFVDGTTNEWQTRRVESFDTGTNFITVEEAFGAEPVAAEAFVLLGRIEL
jgi:hypothetical protein